MFDSLNWTEVIGLLLVGLFVFGPERLPQVIGDVGRMLRRVRQMARNATSELREELGTDLDIDDLNPRTFVRRHLLSEDEQDRLTAPLRDVYRDFDDLGDLGGSGSQDRPVRPDDSDGRRRPTRRLGDGERAPFDADAT
jgi:sec-independent protein translocase protein TatB